MQNVKYIKISFIFLLIGLFLSGIAGIINQVIWQRALKIYLGGSEGLSSMTIVLVFMLGLGFGSLYMAGKSERLKNPLKTFAFVELGLFLVNFIIALILSLDLKDTVYSAQLFTISLGIPIRIFYILTSTLILCCPCFLMGVTMSVAAEACQRQLHYQQKNTISTLFFLNTLGAVIGTIGSGFYLLPYYGQKHALFVAIACNLTSGLLTFLCVFLLKNSKVEVENKSVEKMPQKISKEELLGFFLGFLSLGYEMILFRLAAIIYTPLPFTFSLVLCFFLLFWSIGVFISSAISQKTSYIILLNSCILFLIPWLYDINRWEKKFFIGIMILIYFSPCLFFGILYGQFVTKNNNKWGKGVGRFYAFNTIGSALGILLFTLIGYNYSPGLNAYFVGFGLFIIFITFFIIYSQKPLKLIKKEIGQSLIIVLFIILGTNLLSPSKDLKSFYSRDGVIDIYQENVYLDGLWHSCFAYDDSYIGTKNWLMGVAPIMLHNKGRIKDVLVIGLGTGITATVFTKLNSVNKVDAYEINHMIKDVLEKYKKNTLNVINNPKINIIWGEGRTGLALNPKKYDIISQQPLYLKQAGSSILLSKECMKLAKERLKPNGIYCVYSRSNHPEVSLSVLKTVKSVFKYTQTFSDCYLVIASDYPLSSNRKHIEKKLKLPDPVYEQIRKFKKFYMLLDQNKDEQEKKLKNIPYIIKDDHPIIEYPYVINKRLLRYYFNKGLKYFFMKL